MDNLDSIKRVMNLQPEAKPAEVNTRSGDTEFGFTSCPAPKSCSLHCRVSRLDPAQHPYALQEAVE